MNCIHRSTDELNCLIKNINFFFFVHISNLIGMHRKKSNNQYSILLINSIKKKLHVVTHMYEIQCSFQLVIAESHELRIIASGFVYGNDANDFYMYFRAFLLDALIEHFIICERVYCFSHLFPDFPQFCAARSSLTSWFFFWLLTLSL